MSAGGTTPPGNNGKATCADSSGKDIPLQRVVVDSSPPSPGPHLSCKAVGDMNGDGLADIITGAERGGDVAWYEYPTWSKHVIQTGVDCYTDMDVFDVDGDGDLDVIYPEHQGTPSGMIWLENPMPSGKTGDNWVRRKIGNGGAHDLEVAKNPKDDRLYVLGHQQEGRLFVQTAPKATTWDEFALEGLALADIDGDLDLDIIRLGSWLENPGDVKGVWKAYSIGQASGDNATAGDLNGDGRIDVLFTPGHSAGSTTWWESPADPKQPWTRHVLDPNAGAHTPNIVDVDNDGDLDVILGSEAGEGVALFVNDGKAQPSFRKQFVAMEPQHNVRVADFGNDGDIDFAGTNFLKGSPLVFYEVKCPGSPSPPEVAPPKRSLSFWLAADHGVSTSGGKVSVWKDQSGRGIDASQTKPELQPALMANAINGRPAVRFVPSDLGMSTNGNQMDFSYEINGLSELTIALVSANLSRQCHAFGCENTLDNHGTLAAPISWQQSGDWGTTYLTPLQGNVSFRFGTGEEDNVTVYDRPSSVMESVTLTVAVKKGAIEDLYIQGNKVLTVSNQLTTLKNNKTLGHLGLGRANTYFHGDIGEVLVYEAALSEAELNQLQAYLKRKYSP